MAARSKHYDGRASPDVKPGPALRFTIKLPLDTKLHQGAVAYQLESGQHDYVCPRRHGSEHRDGGEKDSGPELVFRLTLYPYKPANRKGL